MSAQLSKAFRTKICKGSMFILFTISKPALILWASWRVVPCAGGVEDNDARLTTTHDTPHELGAPAAHRSQLETQRSWCFPDSQWSPSNNLTKWHFAGN